jgi:hypothetical protein
MSDTQQRPDEVGPSGDGGKRELNPMLGWAVLAGIVALVFAFVFLSGAGTQTAETVPPATKSAPASGG